MAKRPCFSDDLPRVSERYCDRSNIDTLLDSLIAVSDPALIDASFDGLLDCRATDSDQNNFIERALRLGSVLLEAGKRSVRKRSSAHNALVWPLSHDLTIKVFSMLDTPSVCCAAATCSFFQKCTIDPLCFANIDLATLVPKVNDDVVSTMIQRAGSELQSIKLGMLLSNRSRQRHESSPLTSSCLSSLSANGTHLKRLHLYNIKKMDNEALSASLSVCPSLIDLEFVAVHFDSTGYSRYSDWNVKASPTLESVSRHCPLIERFIYESDGDDFIKTEAAEEFVVSCSKITTLAIKDCMLFDDDAHKLVKGFGELKYVDFSYSSCLKGSFLKDLGTKCGGGNNLEVIILRESTDLDQDISNRNGLAYKGDYKDRRYGASFIPIKRLLKQRPNFCLVAELSTAVGHESTFQ